MISKYSLDEKIKEFHDNEILNEIESARHFIRYFINLVEGVLNYEYDALHTYFEEDKTVAEIELVKNKYEICGGMKYCNIIAYVKLHKEDFSYPKLKVVKLKIDDKFSFYEMDIDNFLYGSLENDDKFITDYMNIIKSNIFRDFVYDWSCNKNKIFKRVIRGKNITPSQYIIDCINLFICNSFIKPKSIMNYHKFIDSEFKFDVDKKTQQIFDRYFFKNI